MAVAVAVTDISAPFVRSWCRATIAARSSRAHGASLRLVVRLAAPRPSVPFGHVQALGPARAALHARHPLLAPDQLEREVADDHPGDRAPAAVAVELLPRLPRTGHPSRLRRPTAS